MKTNPENLKDEGYPQRIWADVRTPDERKQRRCMIKISLKKRIIHKKTDAFIWRRGTTAKHNQRDISENNHIV